MAFDFTDFYIRYNGHPLYSPEEVIQDEIILVIIQKVEMILFTQRGDLLGDPDFGANLEFYLHQTRVSASTVEQEIRTQFSIYIPELNSIPYELNVTFTEHPEIFTDVMLVDFQLKDVEVNAYFA